VRVLVRTDAGGRMWVSMRCGWCATAAGEWGMASRGGYLAELVSLSALTLNFSAKTGPPSLIAACRLPLASCPSPLSSAAPVSHLIRPSPEAVAPVPSASTSPQRIAPQRHAPCHTPSITDRPAIAKDPPGPRSGVINFVFWDTKRGPLGCG
jgi:hypothetical protein